jgi:V8-like Glu-specific endopeptidase
MGSVFIGSGWLYDDKTVVTAGHCLRDVKNSTDPRQDYGTIQATDIAVYLGWSEKSPGDRPESRRAKWVLTPNSWFDRRVAECDIGIIRLETAFTSPKAFPLAQSIPKFGKHRIYVVGYPFDVPPYITEPHLTAGSVMYESSWLVDFGKMSSALRYRADTAGGKSNQHLFLVFVRWPSAYIYPGNSGSPVLWKNPDAGERLEAIGVHVSYDNIATNTATSLWENGNDIPQFVSALTRVEKGSRKKEHTALAASEGSGQEMDVVTIDIADIE